MSEGVREEKKDHQEDLAALSAGVAYVRDAEECRVAAGRKDEKDRMWSTASLGLSQRDLLSNVVGCARHSNRRETVYENKPQSGQTSSFTFPNRIW